MQIIYHGISHLKEALKDSEKVFLVCGNSYRFLGIKEEIEKVDVSYVYFDGYTPNPLYDQVCKGIELFQKNQCDTIMAVGGGSAIDVAKCIKLAVLAKEGKSVLIPPMVNMRVVCEGSKLPFVAIPTTAGSGSESTHNAVMYYEGVKQTVTNDGVLPDYVVLEPTVLKSLPLYQKKCAMMDTLCQGIESWWSINSTEESKVYSKKCVELVVTNWRKYIFDDEEEAAKQIMLAANYSGRAINITATTAAHAMSYKLTSLYKLPHGHAVAVCLPEVWEYMIEHIENCVDKRGKEYLENVFIGIAQAMGVQTPIEAITNFRCMMWQMELVNPISEHLQLDIPLLATSVNPIRLKNNPIKLDDKAIYSLYKMILK